MSGQFALLVDTAQGACTAVVVCASRKRAEQIREVVESKGTETRGIVPVITTVDAVLGRTPSDESSRPTGRKTALTSVVTAEDERAIYSGETYIGIVVKLPRGGWGTMDGRDHADLSTAAKHLEARHRRRAQLEQLKAAQHQVDEIMTPEEKDQLERDTMRRT